MLRFACPRCQAALTALDHQGGTKRSCPKCQECLQVPRPPPHQRIQAPLGEHTPTASPPGQPSRPAPVLRPGAIPPTPATLSRRFRGKWVRTGAEGVGLYLLLIVSVVILIRGLVSVRPGPDREGLSWTHRDLADYLGTRGVKVRLGPLTVGLHPEEEPIALLMAEGSDQGAVVIRKRTPQAAAESADALSDPCFSWGRFLFLPPKGSPSLVPQIREALE